jgi:hypothetical protein
MLNFLTGERSLRRQRDLATEFADEFYGGQARALSPVRLQASQRAVEGMGQAAEGNIREQASQQLFRRPDMSVVGGSQAGAIGMASEQNQMALDTLANVELGIEQGNVQARMAGQEAEAQVTAEQSRLQAIQKAAVRQADMEFEAERSSRRQELFAGALGLGAAFAPQIGAAFGSMFEPPATPERPRLGVERTSLENDVFEPNIDFGDIDLSLNSDMLSMSGNNLGQINEEELIEDDGLVDTPSTFPFRTGVRQIMQGFRQNR